jgi:DNA-directed RNA polymerase I subunit RPA1
LVINYCLFVFVDCFNNVHRSNVYNADFDGDEMNLHLPQDLLATAEAAQLAAADQQYCVPRDGAPARGLIQDHVAAGVLLTKKDTFLSRSEFQQLLWAAAAALDGDVALRDERASLGDQRAARPVHRLRIPQPCIVRPRALWSGKQLVRAMLDLCAPGRPPMSMESSSRVKKEAWYNYASDTFVPIFLTILFVFVRRGHIEEGTVLVRGSDLLTGVLDKAQFGASSFGLVHCAYEIYGGAVAGRLLSSLGRLFSAYLRRHGFTCGIDDLLLHPAAEAARAAAIATARGAAIDAAAAFVGLTDSSNDKQAADDESDSSASASSSPSTDQLAGAKKPTQHDDPAYVALVERQLRRALRRDVNVGKALDSRMTGTLATCTSKTIAACFPAGLVVQFPDNMMSLMTTSGAKGSQVNAAQISCLLGSQELEGRRVPLMASGKSLPCFVPHSPLPRAGGYVSDRYLTGIRPQEYFFHCNRTGCVVYFFGFDHFFCKLGMAGREGLVDTAIKTARSGYLQRCLIKQLENIVVAYDGTVRDISDQSILQFGYGDDALDVASGAALFLGTDEPRFAFHAHNYDACAARYSAATVDQCRRTALHVDASDAPLDDVALTARPAPASHYASVSEGFKKR